MLFIISLLWLLAIPAHAESGSGQWEATDPVIRRWFQSLMQPDRPTISCCGESDAYWADTVVVEGDKVFAIITDDREDAPLRRQHVPVGTKIEIPPNKMKGGSGNPTGHRIVFLSLNLDVYCFVDGVGG